MRQSARSTLLLSGIISMMMSVGRICAFTSSRAASNIASSRKIIGRPETLSYFPSSTSTSTSRWMSSTASNMKPKRKQSSKPTSNVAKSDNDKKPSGGSHQPPIMNLYTISKEELQEVILMWGYPKYRADQVYHWIRERGVVDPLSMENIPKKLRQDLHTFTTGEATTKANTGDTLRVDAETTDTMNPKASTGGSLELVQEQVSPKDGTTKRLYRLRDGYLIESVLMPYDDGRWTSCISSQAGCAQGCVFCATGQMGFQRQLTADEIVEQVTRFATHLRSAPPTQPKPDAPRRGKSGKSNAKQQRLSNIVFMGEGEPLANYRNVMEAVPRIQDLAGIGARKITISTVGVVPNIRKLMASPIQVRLAVSLHCASDEERSALLPANKRYGGLHELMTTLHEYIETTGRRLTLEWALIEGENDTPEMSKKLGMLLRKYKLRRDMVHVNVIPLNPTGGFTGSASGRQRVNEFMRILNEDFGVACTPRVRRGIDIDAGCGQLKSKALFEEEELKAKKEEEEVEKEIVVDEVAISSARHEDAPSKKVTFDFDFATTVDLDSDDIQYDDNDEIMDETFDSDEAARILAMVKGTVVQGSVADDAVGDDGRTLRP